jgi:hypothetical protein
VVLYAEVEAAGVPLRYDYVWQVDPDLVAQANRFIATFNALFGNELPPADADQAETYWDASESNHAFGRCVRLGFDDSTSPIRHYHWAIRSGLGGNLAVHEFWDSEIWTTDRYRQDAMREMFSHIM